MFDQTPPSPADNNISNWGILQDVDVDGMDSSSSRISLICEDYASINSDCGSSAAISGILTLLQCEKLREAFFMFDLDRDGILSTDKELQQLLAACQAAGWDYEVGTCGTERAVLLVRSCCGGKKK